MEAPVSFAFWNARNPNFGSVSSRERPNNFECFSHKKTELAVAKVLQCARQCVSSLVRCGFGAKSVKI